MPDRIEIREFHAVEIREGVQGPPGAAASISDATYDAATWDGVTTVAPSKNAVRDKLVGIEAAIGVSPEAFGAVGDGVTDDTTALQAASNAASTAKLVLQLSSGKTYKITSTVQLNGAVVDGYGAVVTGTPVTLLTCVGDRNAIRGLAVHNTATTGCIGVNIASNATNTSIRDCRFSGVQSTQGISINSLGVKGVLIEGNVFDGLSYGFLSNLSATDLTDVRIIGNRFLNISADPIELNHPIANQGRTPYVDAPKHFVIANNHIMANLGSGSVGGFGIGVAGACHVQIIGNTLTGCRTQAIHIEDEAQFISVVGNTITGCGEGNGTPPGGVYSIGGSRIAVTGNTIRDCTGRGVHFDVDATHDSSQVTIQGNIVDNCTSGGITLRASSSSRESLGAISGNTVTGCGGDGVTVTGPVGRGMITVTGNVVTGCTGYGLLIGSRMGAMVTANVFGANTLGDIGRSGTPPAILMGASGDEAVPVAAGSSTPVVSLFALGTQAWGSLAVRVVIAGDQYTVRTWQLVWDGTTLTTTQTASAGFGAVGGVSLSQASNMLCANAYWGGAGASTAYFSAVFVGTIVL